MDRDNIPVMILIGGLWMVVVVALILTVIEVEHFALMGWNFTLLLTNTVLALTALIINVIYVLPEIKERKDKT